MKIFELSFFGAMVAILVFVSIMLGYLVSVVNYNNIAGDQTQAEMLALLHVLDKHLNVTAREQITSHNDIVSALQAHMDAIKNVLSKEHQKLERNTTTTTTNSSVRHAG